MTMPKPTIPFTAKESELLSEAIANGEEHGPEGMKARRSAAALMNSLLARSAIPAARWRYFTDPELNIGSSVSRQQVFERNNTRGDAIFEHAHFLPYLRYFVGGPDLPAKVVDEFTAAVGKVEFLSGSDLPEIAALVRRLVRQHVLVPAAAAEEFYKLAIELGIEPFQARCFRDAARKVRR